MAEDKKTREKPCKDNYSDWYHDILKEAEIVDNRYPIKGMLVYRRWGYTIIRAMQGYLERLLEDDGHEPVLFPVLIPEDTLGKETEHIAGFEEQVFWVTHAGKTRLERRAALRPTSETSVYEMFATWIRSHMDLPLKIHQSVTVYRYETKHTRPLIRGREFLWNEGHTAFRTNEDAQENIETIKGIYGRLIGELLCLPFQVNRRPDWDKFPGADYTLAFETLMPDNRTLQLATAHNLGQNFSKVFDITFETETGSHEHVYQTSYGPGFGRLLAAVISIHGDEKGLVLPPRIAPVQAVIVPIVFKESGRKEILDYTKKLRKKLEKDGIKTVLDDSDNRPGAKYYYWEMKGVPVRIEVGPRDLKENKVTVVRRDTGEKMQIAEKDLDINKLFMEIEDNLRTRAQKRFDERLYSADTTIDLEEKLGEGVVSIGWCRGVDCAPEIEAKGTMLTISDEKSDCLICGKEGVSVRVAKTY